MPTRGDGEHADEAVEPHARRQPADGAAQRAGRGTGRRRGRRRASRRRRATGTAGPRPCRARRSSTRCRAPTARAPTVSASHAARSGSPRRTAQRAQHDGGGHHDLLAPAVDDRVDQRRAGADPERGVGEVRRRARAAARRRRAAAARRRRSPTLRGEREQARERCEDGSTTPVIGGPRRALSGLDRSPRRWDDRRRDRAPRRRPRALRGRQLRPPRHGAAERRAALRPGLDRHGGRARRVLHPARVAQGPQPRARPARGVLDHRPRAARTGWPRSAAGSSRPSRARRRWRSSTGWRSSTRASRSRCAPAWSS